jgi:hypothetical protein
MVELDPRLVEELELLAPLERAGGSWEDVARRAGLRPPRRRRTALFVAAGTATVVLGLGTAASAAFGWRVSPFYAWVHTYPPGRTGPIVTVFSGLDWNLVAWKSTKGICTSYGAAGAGGSGCSPLPRVPIELDEIDDVSRKESRIIGTISAEVTRIVVRDQRGGSFRAVVSRPLPQLGTTRRFFVAEVPIGFVFDSRTGRLPRFRLDAYDSSGRLLGRAG